MIHELLPHDVQVMIRHVGEALGIGPSDMLMMFVVAPLVVAFCTRKILVWQQIVSVLITPPLFWVGMMVAS